MKPDTVRTVLLHDGKADGILFQSATNFAKTGANVWFISPHPFNCLPSGWEKPLEKEILKLITFISIPDRSDFIRQLNGVHTWNKPPKLIIITEIDTYFSLKESEWDVVPAAFVCASLLDCAASCAVKYGTASVIVSCSLNVETDTKLKTLTELYLYDNVFAVGTDNLLNKILQIVT